MITLLGSSRVSEYFWSNGALLELLQPMPQFCSTIHSVDNAQIHQDEQCLLYKFHYAQFELVLK
jgi:hypothetical protein